MPSINFFYSRRFVNAKRETAKRFSLLKNDCFCKTELIIAGFVSLCKTFFNFYSHRFAVSMHIQPFLRRFSHFERLIIHFMGFICSFFVRRVDFLHDYAGFRFRFIFALVKTLCQLTAQKRPCSVTQKSRSFPTHGKERLIFSLVPPPNGRPRNAPARPP